ncbi:MAG: hypothetical protein A3F84_29750 [Candidatus Handelsmanbacteria bacterium RIFCSPLOWO2_12_FULL_64_10]|uniref:Uncharacterized protein n=1 Tax=Handelsmanbacteria sp. (strain RIFCSPLOWO2_12_FULL_64_10) TaxID=1817868 RepID=A0A1F6D2J2_HANXR|nr:MAG: hypothetical protein A3F84_29750 [Candidatus Handelsmanbacteria bacterium RIFCSPLOWO2_12_FULL_64_10]
MAWFLVSHPGITVHCLERAGIRPTTVRFAVGYEDPKDLIAHLVHTARLTIDPQAPGFSDAFASPAEVDAFVKECYLDTHRRYIESKPPFSQLR